MEKKEMNIWLTLVFVLSIITIALGVYAVIYDIFKIPNDEKISTDDNFSWDKRIGTGNLFFNPTPREYNYMFFEMNYTPPLIKISSKNNSGDFLEPPYYVELDKNNCKAEPCEGYCYVCTQSKSKVKVKE